MRTEPEREPGQPPMHMRAARSSARSGAFIGAAVALAAGALASAASAPAWAPVLSLAGFALLGALLARLPGRGARVLAVFAFAAAFIGSGCAWIHDGIRGDGHNGSGITALLFIGFVVLYAFVHAACFAAADRCLSRAGTPLTRWHGAFALACAWIVAEWLRSSGEWALPWQLVGTLQVDNPVCAALLPVGGVYLAGWVAVFAAALAGAAAATRAVAWRAVLAAGAACALIALGTAIAWTEPAGAPVDVLLMQSNYPQAEKWDDAARARAKADLLAAVQGARGGVVVTPETYLLDAVQQAHGEYWTQLAALAQARGVHVLVGGIYADTDADAAGDDTRFYNALVHVAPGRADVYAKRRLVPFGEYMPWTAIPGAAWVYHDVFDYPLRGLTPAGDELGRNLFVAGHEVAPSICYEIAFAGDIGRRAREAAWILNVSNDAWFASPQYRWQAEQIARTRALENRRWVVRANNVGRTALIAPDGSVTGIEEGKALVKHGLVEPRLGHTPYQRIGDAVVAVAALGVFTFGAVAVLRMRRPALRRQLEWEAR